VPLELTRPKNGESEHFSIAIQNKKIIHRDLEELKESLRYAMVKIGLRSQNWPSDEEKGVLIQHIIKNYGGHTVEEIKLAFDMAITGRLDVEVNCYENFSCLYFSNIMSAYREWAKEEYKQFEAAQPISEIENKEDMSQEAMQDWFNVTAKKIKAGEMTVDFVPLSLYEWMDANGNISATPEEKYKYLERAANYRQSALMDEVQRQDTPNNRWRLQNFLNSKEKGYFEGEEIGILRSLAKKILLFETVLNS
jgi:hypothetical protein